MDEGKKLKEKKQIFNTMVLGLCFLFSPIFMLEREGYLIITLILVGISILTYAFLKGLRAKIFTLVGKTGFKNFIIEQIERVGGNIEKKRKITGICPRCNRQIGNDSTKCPYCHS